jgi:RNA polymerase sigma factor (sigma-70 family)
MERVDIATPAPSSREDELLVIRCQLGEPVAFEELVARWHLALWRYIRRSVGDDGVAEELTQDAWLRIFRGLPALREPSRVAPWIFSIARRSVLDRFRRTYKDAVLVPEEADSISDPEPPEDSWEETAMLHAAIAELPPADRETVALFYVRELELSEVAEILQIPLGTVKSRLHRARRALRKNLEMKGITR